MSVAINAIPAEENNIPNKRITGKKTSNSQTPSREDLNLLQALEKNMARARIAGNCGIIIARFSCFSYHLSTAQGRY